MSNVKEKMKIRQGHKVYLMKILGMANETVQNCDESQEKKLKQIRITLQERLDILKTLDGEILELIEKDEEILVDTEDAGKFRQSVQEVAINIDTIFEV